MLEMNSQSQGVPEWGYKLNFSPKASDALHEFCGENKIEGATCPNCHKPFLRLLSLSADDYVLRLDRNKVSFVHLLYCWTCSVPYGEFSYQIERHGAIKVLQLPPRQPREEFGPEGPYEGYTGKFPLRRVALEPLTKTEQLELIERQTMESDQIDPYFGHQVGGYPFIYNPCKTFCPSCSDEMPLLAALTDNATGNDEFSDNPNDSFTGNSGVQMIFHLCRHCSIVTAYHSCD